MSVYVDPLFKIPRTGRGSFAGWAEACHLFADSERELMDLADAIGLERSWVQDARGGLRHFDLTKRKRAQAIAAGAIPLGTRDAVAKMKEIKGQAAQAGQP